MTPTLTTQLAQALTYLMEVYDAMGAPRGPARILAEAQLAAYHAQAAAPEPAAQRPGAERRKELESTESGRALLAVAKTTVREAWEGLAAPQAGPADWAAQAYKMADALCRHLAVQPASPPTAEAAQPVGLVPMTNEQVERIEDAANAQWNNATSAHPSAIVMAIRLTERAHGIHPAGNGGGA